jgi:hypothetical protein
VERFARVVSIARSGNLGTTIRNRYRRRRGQSRVLLRRPMPPPGHAWSARRLNALAAGLPEARRYLEVGLATGVTFELVNLPERVGVDPEPQFDLRHLPKGTGVHPVTSDEYFAENSEHFDLVFIDGLHTYQQTYRDLVNALRTCPHGVILIDDVVPCDEVSAIPDLTESLRQRELLSLEGSPWHGDVFRMVACLADHHPKLDWRTITRGGNPQMVLWRRQSGLPVVAVEDQVLESYSKLTYADVFGGGVPDYFRVASEPEALRAALSAVTATGVR